MPASKARNRTTTSSASQAFSRCSCSLISPSSSPRASRRVPAINRRAASMEMIDAELRLGPPGSNSDVVTVVQPAARNNKPASAAAKRPSSSVVKSEASGTDDHDDAAPASKVQVVGWPPVRAYRKNAFHAAAEARRATSKGGGEQGGLYVKVSMDGAPYLRKVDLRTYGGYRELRDALDALFGCFSSASASASADGGCQFAIAYEDKDGDLMLAGDVPWDMFICSCKKLRIMRGSEAR